jgi:hypothetical protein
MLQRRGGKTQKCAKLMALRPGRIGIAGLQSHYFGFFGRLFFRTFF